MASTHSRIVHAWRPAIDIALSGIMSDPAVQIYGRDGTRSVATPGCTYLDPQTGTARTTNVAYNLVGPGGLVLPMDLAYPVATNLFLNSQAPATQDCAVVIGSVTVTAIGTGYTVTTSAGTATGSGFGLVTNGTAQVLTITGNGTITLTIAGTPVSACVQVQAGALRTPLIVTAGATATRDVDANLWTPPDALTQDEEIIVFGEQDYADGDMGIANQTWLRATGVVGSNTLVRTGATTLASSDYDSGGKSDTITRTLPNRSVIAMSRSRRRTNGIEVGYGRGLSGSATAGGPWIEDGPFNVGHSSAADRAGYGRFGAMRRKGGFSQAWIDALYYGFANGRTVPVVA